MAHEKGLQDFIESRDIFQNTSLHYVALFDEEDFIICLMEQIGKSQDFAFRVKSLSETPNKQ